MLRRCAGALLLAAVALGAFGCGGGKAIVVNRPDWEYTRYETLAIAPTQARGIAAGSSASTLTQRLSSLLSSNGAFTIVDRSALPALLEEQDFARMMAAEGAAVTMPAGQMIPADALVLTEITHYKLIEEREPRTVPRFGVDSKGRLRQIGEDVIWIYRRGAEVGGGVRVIDVGTGAVVYSHDALIPARVKTGTNRPPSVSAKDMATRVARELAMEFYKHLAPTEVEVEFDGDSLIIATQYFDGRYETTEKVPRSLDELMLVVRDLPEECDRNKFRVAVAPQDIPANVFESEEFFWSGNLGPEGQVVTVPVATLSEAGAEKYVAKLYSVGNPEPVLEREFRLVAKGD